MELFMIQSRAHLPQATTGKPRALTNATLTKSTKKPTTMTTTEDQFDSLSNITANYTLLLEDHNYTLWNNSDLLFNATNGSYYNSVDYDYQTLNASVPTTSETWTCKEWTPAQHTLFQTANFFFAAAFLVPGSFKQSVLLVRWVARRLHFFLPNFDKFCRNPKNLQIQFINSKDGQNLTFNIKHKTSLTFTCQLEKKWGINCQIWTTFDT